MLFVFLLVSIYTHPHEWAWSADSAAANTRSGNLMTLIDGYRHNLSLPAIPHSESLKFAAQLHVDDLEMRWHDDDCDSYYTWSDDGGPWNGICIDDDTSNTDPLLRSEQASLINDLTGGRTKGYPNNAFVAEIARKAPSGMTATAGACYSGFKRDDSNVLTNMGFFAPYTWSAYGCAYSDRFCSCFFGEPTDTYQRGFKCFFKAATRPDVCGGGAGRSICKRPGICSLKRFYHTH